MAIPELEDLFDMFDGQATKVSCPSEDELTCRLPCHQLTQVMAPSSSFILCRPRYRLRGTRRPVEVT